MSSMPSTKARARSNIANTGAHSNLVAEILQLERAIERGDNNEIALRIGYRARIAEQ
jgi:hypothetical protein